MKTQLEEIKIISDLLDQTTNKSYRDLESINIGSNHKTKEYILDSLSMQSRKARRLNQILHSFLTSIIEGCTIEDFYEFKLKDSLRNNQCKQDQIESQEELAMLTELIASIEDIH